jgi:hypothetical protein
MPGVPACILCIAVLFGHKTLSEAVVTADQHSKVKAAVRGGAYLGLTSDGLNPL